MIKIKCNEAEVEVGMSGEASQLFSEACMVIHGIWESLGKVKPKDVAVLGRLVFEEIVKSGAVFTTEEGFHEKFNSAMNSPELERKLLLTKLIMAMSENGDDEQEEDSDGEVQ